MSQETTYATETTYTIVPDTDNDEREMLVVETDKGSTEYRGLIIGEAAGTPRRWSVNVSIDMNGLVIPIGSAECRTPSDTFQDVVGPFVVERWDYAHQLASQGYAIDSVELEFAETRPSVYKPLPAHQRFQSLDAATDALRGQARKLALARERVAHLPSDSDARLDVAGYDKHYVDVIYKFASGGKVRSSMAHLRFDVGSEQEDCDVRRAFLWHLSLNQRDHDHGER